MDSEQTRSRYLSGTEVLLLSLVSAVVTANAYYIHPIIGRVAEDFGVSAAMIGAVPALNQIALALGIFLLLPLGDSMSNRRLVSIVVAGQCVGILLMALAEDFALFVAGSTLLGFFTIAPYLLPAYTSKHVEADRLGYATALLTTGVIAGILFARAGGGVVAEYLGWRTIYYIAAGLMIAISLALPVLMNRQPKTATGARPRYHALVFSTLPVIRQHPDIIVSGIIQGANFGIFLAVWLGLGLYLTGPQMGYGVDVVGYLAGLTILNLLTTPRLGAWADRIGARRARLYFAGAQAAGVFLLLFLSHNVWLLIIPIIAMNIPGPMIDVTGRMTFLSQAPEIRTRLMTVYIVLMFAGGGIASWLGTAAYSLYGWYGNVAVALLLSMLVVFLSWQNQRNRKMG